MFLVTTADQNYWKTDERILFLGEWCKIYDQKHIWSKLDYETLPSRRDRLENLDWHCKYLENICEKYLNSFISTLNNLHNEDHSIRYWRIILGPWLNLFVGNIYDKYLSIKSVIDSKKITKTWIPPLKPELWVPKDTLKFVLQASESNNFNLYLYGRIISEIGQIPFEFKNDKVFPALQDQLEAKFFGVSAGFKRNIKRLLEELSKAIPSSFNQIIFSSSGLSFWNEIRLQLSLGQIPYLLSPYVDSPQAPIELDLRKRLILPQGNNEFENLLNNIMVEQIPTDFLEGYSEMRDKSLDAFPKNPKVIFTSIDFAFNHGFKFWSAAQTERGVKLVLTQHGGGYGIIGPLETESHEKKICDKYFTWGWASKEESEMVSMAAGKLQGNQYNIQPDSKGIILMVTESWPIYFFRQDHISVGLHGADYFHRQKRFLKVLDPEVFEILLLRLQNKEYGWNGKERLSDLDPTPKYYRGADSMLSQIKKSRLCVHDYLGTTWLETLSMNFPTVIFWDPTRVRTLKSAQPFLDDLRKVNILHDTPESAAKMINEIFEDPLTWWMVPERQRAKNNFCQQFARKSQNWLEEWKKELLKMVR